MFTLIGVGSGVAFLFSMVGLLFPEIFPDEFKNHNGDIFLYFEATTVIFTLVLFRTASQTLFQRTNAPARSSFA